MKTQFQQVTEFIEIISDADGFIENEYQWLCVCPFTGVILTPYVKNIGTTQFCSLFQRTMKPTSVERHLRRYKALSNEEQRVLRIKRMIRASHKA